MPSQKRTTGDWGEQVAEQELVKRGYTIIERNFNTRFGEIDLIAKEGEEMVFIEVKLRKSDTYGTALESITEQKIQKFHNTVEIYLQKHKLEDTPFRIDVIAIDKTGPNQWKVQHIKAAF